MQNIIKLIFIGILLNLSVSAQSLVFEKVFDWTSKDFVSDFIPTEDQGYAMLGRSDNASFVMKLDANGNFLWKSIIGPVSITYYTWYSQIIQAQNSDLLVAGKYQGDAILLRLSNSGDSISSIHFPYSIDENSFIGVVELENSDLVISERREQDDGNYPPRVFLRCFSSAGILKWSKEIGDVKYPYSLILAENKDFVVTGVYDWLAWYGHKIWVSRYDSLGNHISEIVMDESRGNQIIESSLGYLYVAVDGYSSNGNYKAVKLDSDCELEWKLDNNNGNGCYSNTICQLEPNLFAVGGAIQNSLDITIFNENGDSISSLNYNNYDIQYAKRMFCNETSLTVAANITHSVNNYSILVFQVLLDSLYTSNNSSHLDSPITNPIIFPNPAETVINLNDFQITGEPTTVKIYNLNGELKLIKQFESGSLVVLNVEILNSGYYIAQIITKDKTSFCKFVIKG